MMKEPNIERAVWCDACKWGGVNGELMAGSKVGLRCPKCDSADIRYLVATSPERVQ